MSFIVKHAMIWSRKVIYTVKENFIYLYEHFLLLTTDHVERTTNSPDVQRFARGLCRVFYLIFYKYKREKKQKH